MVDGDVSRGLAVPLGFRASGVRVAGLGFIPGTLFVGGTEALNSD